MRYPPRVGFAPHDLMSTQVTLTLPDEVFSRAQRLARLLHREVADVLRDMVTLAMPSMALDREMPPPPHALGDAEVLALSELELPPEQDRRLGDLLQRQQAGALDEAERRDLAALMQSYQEGLLLRAQALEEAVRRGLRKPPAP